MVIVTLQNKNHPLSAQLQAIYCDSFICRLRGLTFRRHLDLGEGLLLVEFGDSRLDASIHMLFVFMDLGVIWINSGYEVVDAVLARSWRLAYVPRAAAKYILEIHPDRMGEFQIGDLVEFNHA